METQICRTDYALTEKERAKRKELYAEKKMIENQLDDINREGYKLTCRLADIELAIEEIEVKYD